MRAKELVMSKSGIIQSPGIALKCIKAVFMGGSSKVEWYVLGKKGYKS